MNSLKCTQWTTQCAQYTSIQRNKHTKKSFTVNVLAIYSCQRKTPSIRDRKAIRRATGNTHKVSL